MDTSTHSAPITTHQRLLSHSRTHWWLTLASVVTLVILFIGYGVRSTGVYYDDDIAHYLIARASWQHPELFFNTWGRPAFTLLYAPVAVLGFDAVRVFSAVLAGLTCLGGAYLAKLYGVRWYWIAALCIGLQPEFLRQAFSSLTELTFALLLCGVLVAHKTERWTVFAVIAGWLPLARYESLPILAVFGLMLLHRRKFWLLPWLAVPLLLQNSVNALDQGNLTALLFPLDQALGIRSDAPRFDYGTGDALYYIRLLPVAYGSTVVILACLGAFRTRFGLLQITVLLAVAIFNLTYWLVPAAGMAGYARHLAIVAPAVGVLAALGWQALAESLSSVVARSDVRTGLATLIVGAFIIVMARSTFVRVPPFQITNEQQTIVAAADWFHESGYSERFVLNAHTWFAYAADLDGFDEQRYAQITPENVERAPVDSIIIWESHYSSRMVWNTPLEMLQEQPEFRLLRSWVSDDFEMYVYEKVKEDV